MARLNTWLIQYTYLTWSNDFLLNIITWVLLDVLKNVLDVYSTCLKNYSPFSRLIQLTYFTSYSTECSTYPTLNSTSLKDNITITWLVQNIYSTFTQFILKIINNRLNLSSKLLILDSFNVLTRLDTQLTHLLQFLLD